MLDMSWGEVMLIGGVALVVIGPKDLPKALRTLGQITTKVRRMAGEFQSQFNEAIREAELDDVKREVQDVKRTVNSFRPSFNPVDTIRNELKGMAEARESGKIGDAASDPLASTSSTALSRPADGTQDRLMTAGNYDVPRPTEFSPRDAAPPTVTPPEAAPSDGRTS